MIPLLITAQQNTATATNSAAIEDVSGRVDVDPATLFEKLDNMIDGAIQLLPNIAIGIIVFFLLVFLGKFARKLVQRAFLRSDNQNIGIVLGRIANWLGIFVGIMFATMIIVPSVGPGDLIAGLGVGGVAVGFAFKDILQNLLAGILILVRQPFKIGDQIRFGDYEGTVEEIETRATIIKTYDGRQVVIPNGEIYTNPVTVNTAYRVRRSEYDVGIGYGDDMGDASSKMVEAMSGVEGVMNDPAPEVIAVDLASSTVNLRARWWTDPRQSDVMHVQDRVIRGIKQAMDDNFIDMPFPTQIVLLHDQTEETDGDRSSQREGWPAGGTVPRPARLASSSKEER